MAEEPASGEFERARALVGRGDLKQARQACFAAVRHDSTDFRARALLARLDAETQVTSFDHAEAVVKTLLLERPDDPYLLVTRAVLLYHQGKRDDALSELRAASEQHPDDAYVHKVLAGWLARERSTWDEAWAHYKAALRSGPLTPLSYVASACYLAKHKEPALASSLLEGAGPLDRAAVRTRALGAMAMLPLVAAGSSGIGLHWAGQLGWSLLLMGVATAWAASLAYLTQLLGGRKAAATWVGLAAVLWAEFLLVLHYPATVVALDAVLVLTLIGLQASERLAGGGAAARERQAAGPGRSTWGLPTLPQLGQQAPPFSPGRGNGARALSRLTVGALVVSGLSVVVGFSVFAQLDKPQTSASTVTVPPPPTGLPPALSRLAAEVDPAVVDIQVDEGGTLITASGFVLSSEGDVLTNNQVLWGAQRVSATDIGNGRTYKAKVLATDVTEDLAVLKLDDSVFGLATVKLGGSSELAVGDEVVAIGDGTSVAGTPTVTTGVVSALDGTGNFSVQNSPFQFLSGLIATRPSVPPGDDGGPLVDARGRVVGIETGGVSPSFAIPIEQALPLIRPFLG